MFNYLITIEYVGTHYVGWQFQKNGKSIQEAIEKVFITKFLKKNDHWIWSRTHYKEYMQSVNVQILK